MSTQRVYSSDSQWKLSANKENFGAIHPKLTPHALAQLDATNSSLDKVEDLSTEVEHKKLEQEAAAQSIESTGDAEREGMVSMLVQPQTEPAMDRERKRYSLGADKRASQRLSANLDYSRLAPREDRSSEKSSQEDLFLNIAQVEGDDDQTIHGSQEQRKVGASSFTIQHSLSAIFIGNFYWY